LKARLATASDLLDVRMTTKKGMNALTFLPNPLPAGGWVPLQLWLGQKTPLGEAASTTKSDQENLSDLTQIRW